MAGDGVPLNPGVGGPIADAEFPPTRGFAIQRVKLVLGAVDVDSGDVAAGNPVPVALASLPLPSGAATAALQPALNADGGALSHVTNFPATQPVSLAALPALTAGAAAIGSVSVSNLPTTQAVSAAALPLPTGAATSANQATEIASLGTIATASASQATAANQATANTSLSTIATAQGAQGTGFNPPAGGSGILGFLSGIFNKLSGSIAVTGTFFQGTQPVSLASLPAFAATPTVSDSQSQPFQGAVAMTVGTSQATQRSIGVNCTAAGSMTITLADASTISLPLSVGWQTFPFAVSEVNSSTATATYFNLK